MSIAPEKSFDPLKAILESSKRKLTRRRSFKPPHRTYIKIVRVQKPWNILLLAQRNKKPRNDLLLVQTHKKDESISLL